ncbi:unnamed protein product [Rangifer tarandus platyrhynchus]|uniref:Uncharacterized protein n=1 Tax=Rangifer tarandus platyrhynchus TaxID=3082113 RepID=A0ABN8YVW9_RANTA|nr:unnamed protein product [Rangifer tarandus platyrhynchus]
MLMVGSSLQATQPDCQGEDVGPRSAVSSGQGGSFSSGRSSAFVTLGRERGLSWTRVFVRKAEPPPSPGCSNTAVSTAARRGADVRALQSEGPTAGHARAQSAMVMEGAQCEGGRGREMRSGQQVAPSSPAPSSGASVAPAVSVHPSAAVQMSRNQPVSAPCPPPGAW